MRDFKDKVAVITGAASGIGRGIAERCATEGMKLVLADVNAENLAKAASELKALGATVLSVRTDVSKLVALSGSCRMYPPLTTMSWQLLICTPFT